MRKEFAKLIICLLDEKLHFHNMLLEKLEKDLVDGKFDSVYLYCLERKVELDGQNKED